MVRVIELPYPSEGILRNRVDHFGPLGCSAGRLERALDEHAALHDGVDVGGVLEHAQVLDRDFRYGPIAAPVTASNEPPIPSASSSTLPNTSTTVIPETLWSVRPGTPESGHSDRIVQRHRRRVPLSLLIPPAPCVRRRLRSGTTRVARCARESAERESASSGAPPAAR